MQEATNADVVAALAVLFVIMTTTRKDIMTTVTTLDAVFANGLS
jgi:hypothetical protein